MEVFEYKKEDAQGKETECVRVYYERSGSADAAPESVETPARPAVLLLHGWGWNHTCWLPWTDDDGVTHEGLAKILARKYTVYNFDLPGFGKSDEPKTVCDEPKTVWGVNEYVEMLEAFVAAHCPGPVSLVGHSFGGRLSILYASRNPVTVTRIALVDAAGIRPKRTLGYYRRVYTYKFKRWLVRNVFKRQELFEQWRVHQGSPDYKAASPQMKPIFNKVVNEDLKECLKKITAPVLLFWGEKDTATPLADAKIMQKLISGKTKLVVIKDGGHFAAFYGEAGEQFAKKMKTFFEIEEAGDGAVAGVSAGAVEVGTSADGSAKNINKEGLNDGK